MSAQRDPAVPGPSQPGRHTGIGDLLAFLGVLAFAGGLALLIDRTGQLSARLGFAGPAGLVAASVTAWRRLRRERPRRWRSGQVTYSGRRVKLISVWGVEGQPAPAIEPPASPTKDTDRITATAGQAATAPPSDP